MAPRPTADPSGTAPAKPRADAPGGDRFAELYRQHYDAVHRWVRALGVTEARAEDTVQEVFLVVLRRLDQYDPGRSFGAWLFGITRRVARTNQRTERRGRAREVQAPLPEGVVPLEDAVQLRRVGEFVDGFLAGLDEPQRLAFVLCEIEGMTAPEAASALEVPAKTVRARLRIARDKFQRAAARFRASDNRRRR